MPRVAHRCSPGSGEASAWLPAASPAAPGSGCRAAAAPQPSGQEVGLGNPTAGIPVNEGLEAPEEASGGSPCCGEGGTCVAWCGYCPASSQPRLVLPCWQLVLRVRGGRGPRPALPERGPWHRPCAPSPLACLQQRPWWAALGSTAHLVGLAASLTFKVARFAVFPLPDINKKASLSQVKMHLIRHLSCSLSLIIPLILT